MQAKNQNLPDKTRSKVISLVANRGVLALIFVGISLFVLYESFDRQGKEQSVRSSQCSVSESLANKVAPRAIGELASLSPARDPDRLVKIKFHGPDGSNLDLSDFAGRLLLVNLWATWCLPCRAEMPALDRLQSSKGGADFAVVAINIDTARLERRQAFLKEAGIQHLAFYSDKSAAVFQVLRSAGKASGLPTTLLIGPDGCEIASMAGAAEWDSEEAMELISSLLKEWRRIGDQDWRGPS
jgi:thiol-disulfide isomerase/thioredoxin